MELFKCFCATSKCSGDEFWASIKMATESCGVNFCRILLLLLLLLLLANAFSKLDCIITVGICPIEAPLIGVETFAIDVLVLEDEEPHTKQAE